MIGKKGTSMKHSLQTPHAPAAIGPYSQGISVSGQRLLFLSGQLPIDPVTGVMPENIQDQTKQALSNLQAILQSAGAGLSNVVKTTVFLKDMNDFAAMNEVYASFFEAPFPARACVEVARLPKDAKVEIEAVAVL